MSSDTNNLFNGDELSGYLRSRHQALLREVDGYPSDYVLKVSLDDLADHLTDEFGVKPVVFSAQVEIVEHGETKIDVSHDPRRDVIDRSRPCYVNGTYAVFVIPFTGDEQVFRYRPSSQWLSVRPTGDVVPGEVRVRLDREDHDANAMRGEFEVIRKRIQQQIDWGAEEIRAFNSAIRQQAKNRLEWRKKKILDDQGMVAALGFPIRQRPGAAATYTSPVTRKKLPISKPAVSSGAFKPEPTLEMDHYEHILSVVSNMVLVMERSPGSFARLDEEGLRTHILVQLNGHYEGQATGETFNAEGKTDILIRAEGRNIFIAECKFWSGAEVFKKTIDQLLGYTAWRDTKTAIIVFSRNKDTSAVVRQIPDLVKAHSNFKREITSYTSETGCRFLLHHRDDKNRELTVTVMVFDVPL